MKFKVKREQPKPKENKQHGAIFYNVPSVAFSSQFFISIKSSTQNSFKTLWIFSAFQSQMNKLARIWKKYVKFPRAKNKMHV